MVENSGRLQECGASRTEGFDHRAMAVSVRLGGRGRRGGGGSREQAVHGGQEAGGGDAAGLAAAQEEKGEVVGEGLVGVDDVGGVGPDLGEIGDHESIPPPRPDKRILRDRGADSILDGGAGRA